MRIWSSYCKFIKSECIKGKIIDSMFFGLFYQEGMNTSNSNYNDLNEFQRYVMVADGR